MSAVFEKKTLFVDRLVVGRTLNDVKGLAVVAYHVDLLAAPVFPVDGQGMGLSQVNFRSEAWKEINALPVVAGACPSRD